MEGVAAQVEDFTLPVGEGELIMVVEDDPDVRLVTIDRLERLGYKVVVAADGPSALALAAETTGIRLALLDVVMPGGLDGHEVAARLEETRPDISLVLMSGYSAKMVAGMNGANRHAFLSKPVSLIRLARTLRSVLGDDQAS